MRGRNQTLTMYFLGGELAAGSRARDRIGALLADVASGALHVIIDRTYPLADAHAYAESRQAVDVGGADLIPAWGHGQKT